jgi:nicotinate phosphoribosyltransferase
MLDDAGLVECKIVISNSMDEYIIRELIRQGAEIDSFGVGERLITAKSDPVFGGVYKVCAIEDGQGNIIPKIKISENVGKITTPHFKKVYRLRGRETGKAEADLICLYDETIDDTKPLEIFDPVATWKRKTLENYTATELLVQVFKNGEQVYTLPTLAEIRQHCAEEIEGMWDEVRRFSNPHNYYVDLSEKLWKLKHDMLAAHGRR